MKNGSILFFYFLFTALTLSAQNPGQMNTWQYYFDRPAQIWEESIPLGNGRIGMMPWGGVDRERVVLNEISLWSGNKQDADNPEAYKYLGEIRRLLFERKNMEAQDLMYKTFTCKGKGSAGADYGKFQNFGNLYVDFIYPDASVPTKYKRTLDMNNALSTVSYTKGEVNYQREYHTSFSDDLGLIKYTADKPKALSMRLSVERDENYKAYASGNILYIFGQLPAGENQQGMKYLGMIKVLKRGGSLSTTDKDIIIKDADEVTLYLSLVTNYKNKDHERLVSDILNKAGENYNKLKSNHIREYQKLFNRVDLTLAKNSNSGLPIDKRLEAFVKDRTDNDLAALYMQYGRYLLISSTRVGGLPPNLQGLWAPQLSPPWNGDYHLNINLQMNLWPAEVCNLSELHKPLIEYVNSLVEPGSRTARVYYDSDGWVTHILGNVWDFTSPGESPSWGATNTSGAWLCQHLWEHYAYTQDIEYLKSVYPTIKGAARFFEDMLVEDPNNGYLVTAPTTSPENSYKTSSGDVLSICAGSAMDNQIIRELFSNVSAAARLLDVDKDWIQGIEAKKAKLAPTTIGKHGQIMEWLEDYDEAEIHHRHVSQLYALHPGYELTYEKTPELMQAAKTTLERRGDESTGWSMAWKINFWARLKDGERTYKLIGDLLKPAGRDHGTYPNLFSSHPPMQIDGNFGGCAGIAEMLVQSHAGYIELLPSVPRGWADGSVRGLKVRGGGEVSFAWKNGSMTDIEFKAVASNTFTIKLPDKERNVKGIKNYRLKNDMLTADLKKGQKITIIFNN
ncbi:glycoside hydrolase N-terminal domain-containing protein [Prevotella sp. 10(H)]|uniref:glycoside hydrolase family 95 protein n=1 Tax=Prevotella sp. 10(H) TaxID=1158294 RepID=UPI0004A70982